MRCRGAASAFALLSLVLMAVGGGRAAGIEVWTPETGEVALDEAPRDSAQEQRRHALALMAAGQVGGGAKQLRRLIEADPQGDWVPEARFALARGLLAAGRAREAFDELADLLAESPEGELAPRIRSYQFTAAQSAAAQDVDEGVELYARIIERSSDRAEEARAQREMADALFEARRYLDAEAEYLAFVTFYPESELGPYCWYRAAECEWELAQWLHLGVERVQVAEQHLRDFVERHPGDPSVEPAREKIALARAEQARMNLRVAQFYSETEGKPWAALAYLAHVRDGFPETPEAEWAAREYDRLLGQQGAATRGEARELDVPGVVTLELE